MWAMLCYSIPCMNLLPQWFSSVRINHRIDTKKIEHSQCVSYDTEQKIAIIMYTANYCAHTHIKNMCA